MNVTKLRNEIDMLEGNINRMMVSDNVEEIAEMYNHACKRLAVMIIM